MSSSHSQDGPSGHRSTPQPQPQAQSQPQPADGQPPTSNPAPTSDQPPEQTLNHTNSIDDAAATTNHESAPSRNLPASSDRPAHPVQPSTPHADGIAPRRYPDHDHMNNSAVLVHNWLNKTDQLPPQPIDTGSAEQVAPLEEAGANVAANAAMAAGSHAQNGISHEFAGPDGAILGQENLQDFSQALSADLALPAESYLPMAGEHLPLSWSIPGPFTLQPGFIEAGANPTQDDGEDLSDDDAASLDEPVLDGTRFERMARLEFADTFVAITTNTTIIGRDQRVYKRAVMNKKRAEGGLSPISKAIPAKRGIYSKSYVSQEGGALGPESDGEERSRSSKRRRTADNGQYTLPPEKETPAADDPAASDNVISSRQYVDHTPGAVPVDMDILRPSSDDVARIDIHGAGPDIIETSKGISRDHLKIQYNEESRVWQATAIGRNGFFCEERLYHKDEVVDLRSGSHLQIQAVGFIFTISGVEDGEFGNEQPSAYFQDGKKMSLDFSNSRAEDDMRDTDDEESPPARIPTAAMLDTDDSDDSDGEPDRSASPKPAVNAGALQPEPEGPIRPTIESDPVKESTRSVEPGASQAMVPPKKRGPGRPPKNGVMSKREERELKKKREEEDKKNNPPQEPGEPPIKRKVGRPRKHPRPEDEGDQPEKRKYKPRKPKNEDGEDEEDPEGDKADKQKRIQKPKTPPLDLGEMKDWPEEKLQKPPKNYQTLIDEVLTSAAPDGLTLKQIYKRIATNYPFFHFCTDTKGWESSVRHNLIGSDCFKKNNDTHLWKRVPGIPLESGKKRKPSDTAGEPRPPPIYNGNYNPAQGYQQPPHPQQYPNQHMVPTGGGPPMNGMPRYQPSGQAHPAPIPNSTHPATTPSQQAAIRQGFPQQQQQPPPQQLPQQQPPPTTVPQANTYAATAGPPRPQYPTTQQQPYNSAFNQRQQQAPLAHGTAPGSHHQIQNHAQHSLTGRPGQGVPPTTQRGPTVVHPGPAQQNHRGPGLAHPQQPIANTVPPAALGPAVEPSLKEFLGKFSSEVVKQLQGRVKRPHAVAVSVINRGLGLTDMSLAPEHENFENAIINIFHTHKLTYSKPKATAVSTAAKTESPRPPSATTAPTVNGNGTASATGSAPVAPSLLQPTPISASSGSGPNGSAPNGSNTAASNASGSLTTTANAPNGTNVGTHPVPGRNEPSTTGSVSAGPTAAPTAPETPNSSTAVGAANPPGSSSGVQSAGAPAVNSPVPSRSSVTPAPGTPAPDANNVQLLDPKLVDVIQQYKRLSQQVLIPQVGQLQAEILVMSAVNRVLGFTTESIVPHSAQSTKLGLKEAEDALIRSLRPRVDSYVRGKQAPSAVPSTAPATPTPTPVHANTALPLPLSAPSR